MKKINYGMYDFANSSFSAIIITFVFSTYFARQIVGDVQLGAAYWQWTTGVCGLLIAITGPYLGIVADKRKNGLINFLRIFTILCILITCLFWFSKPEASFIFYTLIIFLCSNYCYEIAQIFYNSLLQQSSEKNKLGSTSGLGFGLGYLGTIPVLLLVLYFFILSDEVLFDLNKQEFENIRFTALIVALWFLLFAIPMLFFFKDKTSKDIQTNNLNFKSLIQIIWQNKLTEAGKFLIARMLYADALIVLISGGGVYASGVFGFSFNEIIQMAIFSNVIAFLSVIVGGFLNDKYSSKNLILISIAALTLCIIYASLFAVSKSNFFTVVMVVSMFIGIIQSASRVMMTSLIREEQAGRSFGLFAFSGRITSFAGPLLVGTMTYYFSQRIGLFSNTLLFVLGFYFMLKIKNK